MLASDLPVLPTQPGCYLFHAPDGEVIYVGKAINLRSRVRSYFSGAAQQKARLTSQRAARLEFIVTKSEVEALVLESNLIKRYKPFYNVLLKDDKSYPFLKLTKEEYPMLLFTRRIIKDGAAVVSARQDAAAEQVLRSAAAAKGATIAFEGADFALAEDRLAVGGQQGHGLGVGQRVVVARSSRERRTDRDIGNGHRRRLTAAGGLRDRRPTRRSRR